MLLILGKQQWIHSSSSSRLPARRTRDQLILNTEPSIYYPTPPHAHGGSCKYKSEEAVCIIRPLTGHKTILGTKPFESVTTGIKRFNAINSTVVFSMKCDLKVCTNCLCTQLLKYLVFLISYLSFLIYLLHKILHSFENCFL